MFSIINDKEITEKAKQLFIEERSKTRLDGWFIAKECVANCENEFRHLSKEKQSAYSLQEVIKILPLEVSNQAIFVGAQRDAFARSYALINPSFKVEEFSGYCDPTAVFSDIEPNEVFTKERIEKVRKTQENSDYVRELTKVYESAEKDTKEVVYFVEQVTGHLIPDFRGILKNGLGKTKTTIVNQINIVDDEFQKDNLEAMLIALESVEILIARYKKLVDEKLKSENGSRLQQLSYISKALGNIAENGATTLFEAIQLFMLLWQVMCIEQAPNPFAFSVGNADRIFEPYRAMENLGREQTSALLKHLLVFFNVGDRSWAISQNLIISGKNIKDEDLTNETSYALLDAYFDMNLPQPILSVKLHKNTTPKLYEELGRFFFTPGMLTPSLFNDDSMFEVLKLRGVSEEDLEDYSVAGCQEPLIMGKDNGNTTNSWLNLPKVLELTLTGGKSLVTGENFENFEKGNLENIKEVFYKNLEDAIDRMVIHANDASRALSNLKVPFLSISMGGIETGFDLRDVERQGTKYNGSGCLVHGLSVVADSFVAISNLLKEDAKLSTELIKALESNFEGYDSLLKRLKSYPKFGNNINEVDDEVCEIVYRVSAMLENKKNYLGNSFRPDFSSPSTHLLYGYWVGATPDGRKCREMLGYGIDPLFGESSGGMGFRVISNLKLPFEEMKGGYASHFGVDPKYFRASTLAEKGLEYYNKIIKPLFFNELNDKIAPFYIYMNVTTPQILRKVLENPDKYAPTGVYIMRIHGTFVNFLDLSPAIQEDIIKRLDLKSTAL